ncbi:MAG TPA: hypothetical protein VHU19_15690 [Pyrinomonadaceae bacterium]|jgi:hypothetical protein|nr:hypothetical protein [Pyrinomonadaceae bacterium]
MNTRPFAKVVAALAAALFVAHASAGAQQQPPQQTAQRPAYDSWEDGFQGGALDESKWERFSFEGAGGGKVEVKDGAVHIRSANGSRAGIRSRQDFSAEQFSVEAKVAGVGPQILNPGDNSAPLGFAALTLLFDGSGRNRIEWILTSEGTFEAWSIVDGRGERLDNRKLGTKLKNPVLGIVRRGDEFLFVLNGPDSPPEAAQVGLKKTIKNLPRTFRVMLYGFGSSENDWDAVRVVTMK